jgi:hypothetical protein
MPMSSNARAAGQVMCLSLGMSGFFTIPLLFFYFSAQS